MKKFLAIYLGDPNSATFAEWNKLDEATRQKRTEAGMKAWYAWGTTHKAAIVVEGGPLGKTKRASASGISDTRNNMSGYVVVQAESHQAAAHMFENHPHFAIFPGVSVDIMEVLPIPGQS